MSKCCSRRLTEVDSGRPGSDHRPRSGRRFSPASRTWLNLRNCEAALEAFRDEPITTHHYEEAARLFNLCRSHGVECGSIDILICAVAVEMRLRRFDQRSRPAALHSGFTSRRTHPVKFKVRAGSTAWFPRFVLPGISPAPGIIKAALGFFPPLHRARPSDQCRGGPESGNAPVMKPIRIVLVAYAKPPREHVSGAGAAAGFAASSSGAGHLARLRPLAEYGHRRGAACVTTGSACSAPT